jgi:hypothetical protein
VRPELLVPLELGEELAATLPELELLPELHAASSTAAVTATPGAAHRFHLCVIAL